MKSFTNSSMENDSWQLTPLTMSSTSSSSLRQRSCSALSNDYSYLQLQSLNDHSKQQEQQDNGFYMFGGENTNMKLGKDEPQKTIHRFIDEWPHKGRDSWLDLDDKSSTTQLSISIPTTSSHDFPTFTSTSHHGNSNLH